MLSGKLSKRGPEKRGETNALYPKYEVESVLVVSECIESAREIGDFVWVRSHVPIPPFGPSHGADAACWDSGDHKHPKP